jgi:hypothetical protein
MTYQITWLLENRILYVLNTGIGTAEDVVNSTREVKTLLEQSRPFVHMIVDGQQEANDIKLGDLLTILRTSPASPNLGWFIYVSESKMNRFFGSMASQMTGAQTKAFATLAEALAFLQHVDQSLPDNIPLPE